MGWVCWVRKGSMWHQLYNIFREHKRGWLPTERKKRRHFLSTFSVSSTILVNINFQQSCHLTISCTWRNWLRELRLQVLVTAGTRVWIQHLSPDSILFPLNCISPLLKCTLFKILPDKALLGPQEMRKTRTMWSLF